MVPETGGAETFVSLAQNHVIAVVTKFSGTKNNGAAAKSLALGSVCGKTVSKVIAQAGVRVETAAVAKPCISASRVRESAMTIEKICNKNKDLTFPVRH